MEIKITKKDIIWNYLGTIFSLGSNFILLPFLMYFLDESTLGLWYIFLNIGSFVILFDFGFNPTLARNVAYCWSGAKSLNKVDVKFVEKSEPNFNLLKKVIDTCKYIYLVISVVALVVLLTIGTMYVLYVSREIKGYNYIVAWFIYCIAVFLNLYYGYYTTFLRGIGAIADVNKGQIFSRVVQLVSSIILFFCGLGITSVAIGYLLNGIIFRTIAKNSFYKFNDIEGKLKKISQKTAQKDKIEMFNIIWHNAWRDGLVSLSNYLVNNASTFICSMFFTLAETGVYSLSVQLVTGIVTVASSQFYAYLPSLQSGYISHDYDKLKKLISKAICIYYILFWGGMSGLIFVAIPILGVIYPKYVFDIPILLTIGFYMFIVKRYVCYTSYISSTNQVPYVSAFIVSSIGGVILSLIVLISFDCGIWGVVLSQIFVQMLYNAWYWPKQVKKNLSITNKEMIRLGILEQLNRERFA